MLTREQLDEFFSRLEGEEGCDFKEDDKGKVTWKCKVRKMEEKEIKFSIEDIRKTLEKFKGATLYQVTIENIIDDLKEDFLKNLKIGVDIHDYKIDGTMTNDAETDPVLIELMEGKKKKPGDNNIMTDV